MINYLKNLKRIKIEPGIYKSLPEEAGVYVFWGGDTPIYIGKAKNLKSRVSSYFNLHLYGKTGQMIHESEEFSFIKVNSELESLLLEAFLIKNNQPKYNFQAKDDKHPLYIAITNEKYPRIATLRKVDLDSKENKAIFGPFPSSTNVRLVLKMLRRIFPFSDHKLGKRPCIESHIGLCNPCPNFIKALPEGRLKEELTKKYRYNLRMIKEVLERRLGKVMKDLQVEMEQASKVQDFEHAARVREKIERLNYITQPIIPKEYFLENPEFTEELRKKELKSLENLLKDKLPIGNLSRIECFDVAHLSGVSPTASMVTFINGTSEKAFYRHFKINQKRKSDDVASMKELIERRLKHLSDWGEPDLIIVDGGKTQSKVFFEKLEKTEIPIVGLAKRFETFVIPKRNSEGKIEYDEIRIPEGPALNLVQRVRNEAHRFARRLHHKHISRSLIP